MTNSKIFEQNFEELKSLIKSTAGEQKGSVLFDFLNETIKTLINSAQDEQNLIEDFIKFLQYADIKYFTIKSILNLVKIKSKLLNSKTKVDDEQSNDEEIQDEVQDTQQDSNNQDDKNQDSNNQDDNNQDDKLYSDNLTKLLLSIKLPIGNTEKGQRELDNLRPLVLDDQFKLNYESASKLYSDTWQMFLSFKLSFESYKKILAAMDTKILPHFKSPLNLTDFLINSYKIGGSVSLLSLSSLFLLITKYNLDYPDFYTNFYALVTPEILHVKYRSRFLYWTDIFLSSTNLPAYVVASFVKKFSRLALIASVEVLYPLIPLIANCLIRHPNLMELFNKSTDNELLNDPFKFEETNLKETRALESSLWELKTLQKHWNQNIREEAKFINYTLPKDEYDLSDLLEVDFPDLVEQAFSNEIDEDIEMNSELGQVALEFFN